MNSISEEPGHSSDGLQDGLRDAPGADRFELVRDSQVVGRLKYKRLAPNRYVLLHTEVDPAQRGRGLGRVVVESVLDEIRSRQGTVTVICAFVADFLTRNEQYRDVVDARHPGHPDRASAERAGGADPS